MKKKAQHTKFDNEEQKHQYSGKVAPQQYLLFPEYKYSPFEKIKEPANKALDLELPEIPEEMVQVKKMSPEKEKQISYWLDSEIKERDHRAPYQYRGMTSDLSGKDEISTYETILNNNKVPKSLEPQLISAYEKLRKKSQEFYTTYKEANQLAAMEFEPNTDGTYADMFRNYAQFVGAELTKEIGRLFGTGASQRTYLLEKLKSFNIFNVTAQNFNRVLDEMESITIEMDRILIDYNHRKKLTKKLQKELDEEITALLEIEHYKKFLEWMDEYFPSHKDEFIADSISKIRSQYSDKNGPIRFGDLVKFKTFKSIYEKSRGAVGHHFKQQIGYSLEGKIKDALVEQIDDRLKKKANICKNFIDDTIGDLKESYLVETNNLEAYLQQIVSFLRKTMGIDVRAIVSFATAAVFKSIDEDYSFAGQHIPTESERAHITGMANGDKREFIRYTLVRINQSLKDVLTQRSGYDLYHRDVTEFVHEIIKKNNWMINLEDMEKIIKLNTKELDQLAGRLFQNIFLDCLPGFKPPIRSHYATPRDDSPEAKKNFSAIKGILQQTEGKFSIEAFTNYAHKHLPFVPKEVILPAIKNLFKQFDNRGLGRLINLEGTDAQSILKIITKKLKEAGKLESNNFAKILHMSPHYSTRYAGIRVNLPKSFSASDVEDIVDDAIKNIQTVERDLENLTALARLIHDEAGLVSGEVIKNIVKNKNFANFGKVGIVRKLIAAYAQIKSNGGIQEIYSKYGDLINELQERELIGKDFKTNLELIEKILEGNEEFSPKSANFRTLFETSSKIESDLAVLQMGEALKELTKDYQKKDENLFKLDQPITDSLRFRVLKDKDPRILRIGIETDCCQRIGGVGETAAKDSYINPLASVLILEWKNPETQDWELLAQSYFHYVPKENGYILDNVESNSSNVSKFSAATGMTLNEIYAIYGQQIRDKINASYLLAGKSYSKIDTGSFKKNKRYQDPRYFDNRALSKGNRQPYSDYDEKDSMDLYMPKINVQKALQRLENSSVKKASRIITQFVKGVLYPSLFLKQAQQTPATIIATLPQKEDLRSLPGAKINLLGPKSWEFVNQFGNVINEGIYSLGDGQKLGGQTINFQAVVRNPSAASKYTGGLKQLFIIATNLWKILTETRPEPYNTTEVASMIDTFTKQINSTDFSTQEASKIKTKLISVLQNWRAAMGVI